jgi:hypothetical protein
MKETRISLPELAMVDDFFRRLVFHFDANPVPSHSHFAVIGSQSQSRSQCVFTGLREIDIFQPAA